MSGSPTAPPSSAASSAPSPAPFRGPAADSRLGELLLDALPLACAVGHALDLSHCLALCGATWRRGVRRADGSLDRAGFLGGTNDMMARSLERQAPWLAEALAMRRKVWGVTQLTRAAHTGDEKRVRELVAAGAKLDFIDGGGYSALHHASANGHARIAKLLLDGKYEGKGADINLQGSRGHTPLMWVSYYGDEAVVRLLLERGADVTLVAIGRTALSWARLRNHAAVMALLKAHGAPE
jgi:hypothetical protein